MSLKEECGCVSNALMFCLGLTSNAFCNEKRQQQEGSSVSILRHPVSTRPSRHMGPSAVPSLMNVGRASRGISTPSHDGGSQPHFDQRFCANAESWTRGSLGDEPQQRDSYYYLGNFVTGCWVLKKAIMIGDAIRRETLFHAEPPAGTILASAAAEAIQIV